MDRLTQDQAEKICRNLGIYLGKLYVRQLSRADKMDTFAPSNLGGAELLSGRGLVDTSKPRLVYSQGRSGGYDCHDDDRAKKRCG